MVATFVQNGHKPRTANLPHQQIAQNHRQKVKDLLPNRTVGYSPDLARIVGGATTGLFLSQLLFLSDKGNNPEGWVYKSEAEMGRETGLTKREQQTARRKLLALGVIQIERRGFKFTYHFKVIWERLYQVIQHSQRAQTVPTEEIEPLQNVATEQEQNVSTDPDLIGAEEIEPVQNVSTEQEQNVSTEPDEWEQNVSTKWKQNVAAQDRDYNTENKETEITTRENHTIWQKALEQLKTDLPPGEAEARLTGTTLLQVTETAARILVPSTKALLWLERRLYRQVHNAIKGVIGKDLDLQFVAAT
jgi:hypothetical protein